MKIFLFLFFIFCFGCASIRSIELRCEFKTSNWGILGTSYYCRAVNQGNLITNPANRNIHGITGSHHRLKTSEDVKIIFIYTSNVFYFPLGLDKIFNSLEGIIIRDSKLKEIRQEDLKPFTKLRYLELGRNELHIIEKDLFQFNLKLEAIYLSNNRISHIDSNVFDNFVGQLSSLRLNGNICAFEDAFNNKQMANEIIRKVQSGSCNSGATQGVTTSTTTLSPMLVENQFEEKYDEKLEKLLKKLDDQSKELRNVKEEFRNEVQTLKKQLEVEKMISEDFQERFMKELKNIKEEVKTEIRSLNKQIVELKISPSNVTTECLDERLKFVEKTVRVEPQHGNDSNCT